MKILVTGSAGLVGSQVVKDLVLTENSVFAGYHNSKPENGNLVFFSLDAPYMITSSIEKIKPDAIIHLAAMTDVDKCETEKDLAMKINCEATKIIAKEAKKQNAFLIYVSTDYVFDGEKGQKKESDSPSPVDYYGKSKFEGEKAVMNEAVSWCIARISTPYGIHATKSTFPVWVAKNLNSGKEINVIVDQFTSPTYVPNLSKMLIEIMNRKEQGILHVSGATRISRYEFAKLIAEKLDLDQKLLKQGNMDDMNWVAKRPKDSSLDVSNALSMLNEKPQTVEQGLEEFVRGFKLEFNK